MKNKKISIPDLYHRVCSNMFDIFDRFAEAGVDESDLDELYANMTNLIDMYTYLLGKKNIRDQKER